VSPSVVSNGQEQKVWLACIAFVALFLILTDRRVLLVHSPGYLVGNHGGECEYVDVSNWSKLFSDALFLISSSVLVCCIHMRRWVLSKSSIVVEVTRATAAMYQKTMRGHPKLYSKLLPHSGHRVNTFSFRQKLKPKAWIVSLAHVTLRLMVKFSPCAHRLPDPASSAACQPAIGP
jgi:hypothetical protein